MPNNKINPDALGNELKFADAEKSVEDVPEKKGMSGAEFLKKESKMNEKGRGNINAIFKRKKKFPLALDIIIAILAIAIVAGAIFGAYFAFVYFSDDSEEVTVEYAILVSSKNGSANISKGNDIYFDNEGKTYYFGSVVNLSGDVYVEGVSNPLGIQVEYMLVYVRATVNYRDDDGFSVNDQKIAVGKDITFRAGQNSYSGTIVELNRVS